MTAEENNGGEVETETPITLGLTAKLTKTLQAENSFLIPKEVSLKQLGDQMDNVNESVKNENMVSEILKSLAVVKLPI